MRSLALLALFAACAAVPRPTRAPFEEFVQVSPEERWDEKERWLVSTSVRELAHPARDQRVTFLSMLHVGGEEYYRGLEPYLADADLVLAEGLHAPAPPAEGADDVAWVARAYDALARVLGLARQAEWERRVADERWQTADALYEDVQGVLEGALRLEFGFEVRAFVAELEGRLAAGDVDPALRRRAYRGVVNGVIDSYRSETTPVRRLDAMREESMWRALDEALDDPAHRHVVMICGAYHTWELEGRLVRERKFRLARARWHDAMAWHGPLYEVRPVAGR